VASALFILLYVTDELTFDTMHPYAANTYRMGYKVQFPNGNVEAAPYAPAGWDNFIQSNYEGIGGIASYTSWGMPTSINYVAKERIVLTEDIIWAEQSVLDIIYLPLVKGGAQPLKELNSLLLTESAAQELFGDEDPINKTVSVSHAWVTNGQTVEMMVTGVIEDLPSNSHIKPKYIANILALKPFIPDLENVPNTAMGDGNNGFWTQSYFVCDDPGKIETIKADLQARANEIIEKNKWDIMFTPVIRKITEIHFDQEMDWTIDHKTADIKYMYVFVTIALMILLVACINYINLATARSASRAREIGLRKTFGGFRIQLFFQFMMESFVLVVISAVIALLTVALFIPQFNNLTGKSFSVLHLFNGTMMLVLIGVIFFVTLLAGSYPALFVSGFQPASVLKGKFAFGVFPNLTIEIFNNVGGVDQGSYF
jgi:putative ABC transport system permease protein